MTHLSSDNSGDNDKTNPFPNKPDHPAVDGKNARKAPSLQHSYNTPETIIESPDSLKSRILRDILEFPTSLKSSNLDKQWNGYIKQLATTISASLAKQHPAPGCNRNTGTHRRNTSTPHQWTGIESNEPLEDLMFHLISTLGKTISGQSEYYKNCSGNSDFPVHGYNSNLQPTF